MRAAKVGVHSTIRPPAVRTASFLNCGALLGMTTVQGIPSAAEAQASACPWLPEECVQTPPAGRPWAVSSSKALVTPRILKAPDF